MTAPAFLFSAIGFAILCYTVGLSDIFADFANAWIGPETREERGLRLLKEWLSQDQLASFNLTRSFVVTGCDSGKRYRITYGAAQNVYELDEGDRSVMGLCFVPEGYMVAGDVMLAQKIALETDEAAAMKVARRFPPRAGGPMPALSSTAEQEGSPLDAYGSEEPGICDNVLSAE
jgi:hypothetical protein